jgi:hypothetical protein
MRSGILGVTVFLICSAIASRAGGPAFIGAPGRAHSLGGESPLHTRQGEVLAEQQGCPSRGGIWRKLKAKRWPDEQEADRGGAVG